MRLKSGCLSGPKIKVYLRLFPFLYETYGEDEFDITEAVRRVNAKPELGIWAHVTNHSTSKREEAKVKGFVTLDLQNACHCFADRGKSSSVVITDTDRKLKLLEKVETANMLYRIIKHPDDVPVYGD